MVILPLPRLPPPLLASQSHLNTVHPSQPPSPRSSQQPPNLKQRTQTWRRREGSLSLASPHPDNYREQAERVEVNQQTDNFQLSLLRRMVGGLAQLILVIRPASPLRMT